MITKTSFESFFVLSVSGSAEAGSRNGFKLLFCEKNVLFRFLIKQMDLGHIQRKCRIGSHLQRCAGIDTCRDLCSFHIKVQEHFRPKHLIYIDLGFDNAVRMGSEEFRIIRDVLRTNSQNYGLSIVFRSCSPILSVTSLPLTPTLASMKFI